MSPLPDYDWKKLEKKAGAVVEACLQEMPIRVREIATLVPTLIQHWATGEGEPEDVVGLLGEYVAFESQEVGDGDGAIVLYVGAIKLYCEEEGAKFKKEVRRTYLHELGHHFGLDEDELADRNLD